MARTVAILFDHFGPYHFARVSAAARELDVIAIEVAAQSAEYEWKRSSGHEAVRLCTLFPPGGEFPERHELPIHTFSPDEKQLPPTPGEGGVEGRHAFSGNEIARRLSALLDRLSPAVVAVPGWATPLAFAALQWCLSRCRPAIVMSESTAIDAPRRPIEEAVKRQVVRMFSAGLVGGIPQSDYLQTLGVPRERIFDGYDVVDNAYFAAAKRQVVGDQIPVIRERLRLPEKFFLASARFIEKKNLPMLLRAYAQYRESSRLSPITSHETPWDLVLLGDGPLRGALEAEANTLNLQECVHMPGFKQYDELPSYYAGASCFVHASTTEQWGLVVNEAMASGLPVLVSDRCGCVADLVADGVNGWSFDPTNGEAITELLRRVAAIPEPERAQMGEASRQRIAAFGPERFANGLAAAVAAAIAVGPMTPSLVQRLILWALLRRSRV